MKKMKETKRVYTVVKTRLDSTRQYYCHAVCSIQNIDSQVDSKIEDLENNQYVLNLSISLPADDQMMYHLIWMLDETY